MGRSPGPIFRPHTGGLRTILETAVPDRAPLTLQMSKRTLVCVLFSSGIGIPALDIVSMLYARWANTILLILTTMYISPSGTKLNKRGVDILMLFLT